MGREQCRAGQSREQGRAGAESRAELIRDMLCKRHNFSTELSSFYSEGELSCVWCSPCMHLLSSDKGMKRLAIVSTVHELIRHY